MYYMSVYDESEYDILTQRFFFLDNPFVWIASAQCDLICGVDLEFYFDSMLVESDMGYTFFRVPRPRYSDLTAHQFAW